MECGELVYSVYRDLRGGPRRAAALRFSLSSQAGIARGCLSRGAGILGCLKHPLILAHHNPRLPIRSRTPVNTLQRISVPPAAHLRNVRNNFRKLTKQFRAISPGNPGQLPIRNLIANLVISPMTAIRTVVPWMRPVSPDQRLHRVKSRVPEEPQEQLELPRRAIRCGQGSASPLPKTSPPKRSLAMNVLVAARKKAHARPAFQMFYADRHSTRTKIKWPARNPFDVRQRREHAPNNRQRINVKHVARLKPAQNLA